ncbi:GumC family protein [Mucilaginibacter calamicampi]|uniref:GumC family protein n=1 Tax=Mucilaginibacter calamicampi TaxID=1302352 RepID=A0ABW2YT16_9SPHI
MDLKSFLRVLKRHKYTIVIIPLIAVIITYFLVRNQGDSYSSEAKIATGIVDQTQRGIGDIVGFQESEINQEFSNLVEMIRSKRILEQVSYKLMIHDLTSDKPFRPPSKLVLTLNASARQHAIDGYTAMYKKRQALSLFNPDQNGMNKLLESMKYDDKSLLDKLQAYRLQNSDYISVLFDSENPELSAVVVNTLCNEFIGYYGELVKNNQQKSVDFLFNLLQVKRDTLEAKMMALKDYKTRNHVLNLNEKAKSLYGQMADFETRREEVDKVSRSTAAAIDSIDRQFKPGSRRYSESNKLDVTQDLISAQSQLHAANDAYVQSGFNPRYRRSVDSLKNVVSNRLGSLSDKYIVNPLATKQDLVDQRLSLQIQNDLAVNSKGAINKEITRLNNKFDELVPHEAATQSLERAVDIASQEYMEILQKYNQASLESSFSTKLRLLEIAEPGQAQPSKKMLLVILAGVASFIACIAVLFILFFLDNSIKNAVELANRTKAPVLGNLNKLSDATIDLRNIWESNQGGKDLREFKNLMRATRFEISNELKECNILLINSLSSGEGKTFFALNLAYAYGQINQKVLVIDANFDNPVITQSVKPKLYLEDILNNYSEILTVQANQKISFVGNKGGDTSILEISSEQRIKEVLQSLKVIFDVIIIEAPALDALNRSKELSLFGEKIITVFEANKNISDAGKHHVEYLKNQNDKFIGWVINLVDNDQLISE